MSMKMWKYFHVRKDFAGQASVSLGEKANEQDV